MSDRLQEKLFSQVSPVIQQHSLERYPPLKQRETEFMLIFRCELVEYVDPFIGFNHRKFFGDFIPQNCSKSQYDYISQEYGKRAGELFLELISIV